MKFLPTINIHPSARFFLLYFLVRKRPSYSPGSLRPLGLPEGISWSMCQDRRMIWTLPLKAQVNSLRSPSLRSPSPTLRLLERSQELRRGCRDTMRVGSSKERELPPSPVHLHPRRSLCDPGPCPSTPPSLLIQKTVVQQQPTLAKAIYE